MATVPVRIPTPLRSFVGGAAVAEVEATTLGGALRALVARHGALEKHLYSADGTLRNFVNVYVNDEDMRQLDGPATPLRAGDTVTIVPAIAGGSPGPSAAAPARPAAVGPAVGGDGEPRLTPDQLRRYSRHLLLPEIGVEGQKKLRAAKVLLVGAGGLGAPAALYLAAAGVGELGLVDFDVVEASNLQRQVLFSTADIGRPKLDAARDRLTGLNPDVVVRPFPHRLTGDNALEVLRPYDVVVDGTDNFPTRYLVNDASVLLGKPNVYGSIYRFEGQASVFDARRGPCYRCLYPEPPPPGLVPSCAEGGVLGVLPGLIGTLQAIETVKLLTGAGEPLYGRLLLFDALAMRFRELRLQKNPDCVLCGPHATQHGLIDYPAFCGVGAEPEAPAAGLPTISPTELAARLAADDPPFVLDVREPNEWEIGRIPGATLIPLGELPNRLTELTRAREVVVYCRTGGRSRRAVQLLLDLGFTRVENLEGGLHAWSDQVDPRIPKY